MNVILEGVVGSTAYGLTTEASDQDYLGIYLAPHHSITQTGRPSEEEHPVYQNGLSMRYPRQ